MSKKHGKSGSPKKRKTVLAQRVRGLRLGAADRAFRSPMARMIAALTSLLYNYYGRELKIERISGAQFITDVVHNFGWAEATVRDALLRIVDAEVVPIDDDGNLVLSKMHQGPAGCCRATIGQTVLSERLRTPLPGGHTGLVCEDESENAEKFLSDLAARFQRAHALRVGAKGLGEVAENRAFWFCAHCGEGAWLIEPSTVEAAEGIMLVEVTENETHAHGAAIRYR